MSTLTTGITPETDEAARRLRQTAAAVRVQFSWFGVHRALTPEQRERVGRACEADGQLLTAGKKLIDVRHPAYRRLTTVRSRAGKTWHGMTLPYPEPGIRLIRQADVQVLVHLLEGFRDELAGAEEGLARVWDELCADARTRLGRRSTRPTTRTRSGDGSV